MTPRDTKLPTRTGLIEAGLHLFGQQGYDGTSTREIAARAGTNIASIAYHFGGKAGLRAACADQVAARISQVLDAVGPLRPDATADQARDQIEAIMRGIVQLLIGTPQARDMVAFTMRELTEPGEITDKLYREFLHPRHKALCALWATATGRPAEEEEVKLMVFAMIGQILYFRIAHPFVARRLGWETIGPDETAKIANVVIGNLHNAIERHRS